jgi:hypothetical protein
MAESQTRSGSWRHRLAVLLALATAVCLGSAFLFSSGTRFLMPGPLTSGHAAIENCSTCHTNISSGKLSWIHGLVAADPLADSKACLSCHKMPDTALNAHGASTKVLKQSTERLTRIAALSTAPLSARAQSIAFPTHDVIAGGLYCATCHQEHKGVSFNLNRISNEQCRSCHVVKFDSFDGHHPNFENYPFRRRTRIIYDHAGHFDKHFPEVAKKEPAKRIPTTCSTCHDSGNDKRVMAVVPFERTCTSCHLDQIISKERVSGPKGIAFLTLPGLDLQTLKEKNAPIGEWPETSEAALTPFMKVMISRNDRGRALIKAVDSLNFQDLTQASDDQLKAVSNLVWEIKGLFYALIKGKLSDVLADLDIGGGANLSASLVADLIANIPRDVVISAQQQWLPNLPAEAANRLGTNDQQQSGQSAVIAESGLTGSVPPDELSDSDARQIIPNLNAGDEGVRETDTPEAEPDDGQETRCAGEEPRTIEANSEEAEKGVPPEEATGEAANVESEPDGGEENGGVISGRLPLPSGTPRAIKARIKDAENRTQPEEAVGKTETADSDKERTCADEPPRVEKEGQPEGAVGASETAEAKLDGGRGPLSSDDQPSVKATDQSDDLLFPTQEELRAIKAGTKDAEKEGQPEEAATADGANAESNGTVPADDASKADGNSLSVAPRDSDTSADLQTRAAPEISIGSDVDPESWAEYGGWYRQDYTIFYHPAGHRDKFIYTWLTLTGPQAPSGGTSPAAAVFEFLTGKDAQGSCTKCHSVDDIQGKGRVVNFFPASVESKQGRFTNFVHEPHFGILDNRGCLTCHYLEKGRPYLKSYDQGNPQKFVSNFGAVKKELCQTCHASGRVRQDCFLCHKYHVNGAISPITDTRIPAQ